MDKIVILGILLSGGDHLAIKFFGMTFRLSQLMFLIYFVYLLLFYKYKIYREFILKYTVIIFPHLISLFYSKSILSSLVYFIFILFNCFIIIMPLINWCSNKSNKYLINTYINIFRIVGILTIVQFIFGSFNIVIPIFQNDIYKGIFRPSLWFYEPSYLATYFSFYIGISLVGYSNNKKKYTKDLLFSWVCTALTTSSTGFIGIGLSMIFLIFLQKSLYKKIKTLLLTLGFAMLLLLLVAIIKFDILEIFLGRLFREGLEASSGVRVLGMIQALEIFKEFFILGIGANSYEKYHFTGAPVTNVTLEILTNLGVIGFFCFCYFYYYLYSVYKKNKCNIEIKMMWISLILFLIILQANQNYMRLYMWIHIGLFIGISKNIKDENLDIDRKD